MPIKSYLVTARREDDERFLNELNALPWTEVIPSSSHDVAILITETPDARAAADLEARLYALDAVAELALVFGEVSPLELGGVSHA